MRTHLLKKIYDEFFDDELVQVRSFDEISDIKDSIVIVNKTCHLSGSEYPLVHRELYMNGNTLYYDIIDGKITNSVMNAYHGFITSSLRQTLYFNRVFPSTKTHYIIHPTDDNSNNVDNSHLTRPRICYWGAYHNTHLDLDNVDYLNAEKEFTKETIQGFLSNHNVHLATRINRIWDGYKPFTKGFIAAKTKSVIITSRSDSDSIYYLGEDYPYFTNDNTRESCQETIEKVIQTYGTDVWNKALKSMNVVNTLATNKIIAVQINNLIK